MKRISSGSQFEEQIAYSRAVDDGQYIFVSGTTGYDFATMTISPDIVRQTDQRFINIEVTAGK
jgi:enamine deaminase RidA (YjgF/YER057c/UK114 family)